MACLTTGLIDKHMFRNINHNADYLHLLGTDLDVINKTQRSLGTVFSVFILDYVPVSVLFLKTCGNNTYSSFALGPDTLIQ